MLTSILAILAGAISLAVYFFVKSPAQKEQDNINKIKEHERELADALAKAKEKSDPSDLSKLVNR